MTVIPAKAGIRWVPAFTGTTNEKGAEHGLG
jgi:hypothetical protein